MPSVMRSCHRVAGLACIALALFNTRAIADCKYQVMAELPVTLMGLHPLINVQIDGKRVPVVLDSGAAFNMLSYDAAAKLHLQLHSIRGRPMVSGVGGAGGTLLALAVAAVRLDAVRITDAKFIVSAAPIGSASGIIGDSILRNYDIDYDLTGRMVKLVRVSGCQGAASASAYWANSQPYSVANIESGGSPPTVSGYLNGAAIRVGFDTGASTSILDIRAAARAGVTPKSPGAVPSGDVYGIGRSHVKTWVVPVSSVRIGDEEIGNTRLRMGDISLLGVDLVLGTDFFLAHRVLLSNSQHKVYITHNGGPAFDLNPLQPGTR